MKVWKFFFNNDTKKSQSIMFNTKPHQSVFVGHLCETTKPETGWFQKS